MELSDLDEHLVRQRQTFFLAAKNVVDRRIVKQMW